MQQNAVSNRPVLTRGDSTPVVWLMPLQYILLISCPTDSVKGPEIVMFWTKWLNVSVSCASTSEGSQTFAIYAPISLYAGALSRRLDANDKKDRVPGIRSACSIGFSIYMIKKLN